MEDFWQTCSAQLEQELTPQQFSAWIKPLAPLDFEDGRRWSSAKIGDFKPTVDPALADFLVKKTRLPLNHAETEADIQP